MLNILIKQYGRIFEKICLFLCLFYLIFIEILIKHKESLRKNYLKLIIDILSILTKYVYYFLNNSNSSRIFPMECFHLLIASISCGLLFSNSSLCFSNS